MRYRAVADNPAEEAALASGEFFLPAVDLMMPLVQARSIMAGVRLGLFEALGQERRTAAEVAAARSLDAACVELVLRVLVCAGYVRRDGSRYELTPLGRETMLRNGPRSMCGLAEFNYTQWDMINRLEEVLRLGRGLDFHTTSPAEDSWASYQRAMLEFARFEGPLAAPLVPVKRGARKLLDIGGSHGLIGAMICRRYPGLRSEVLDLPQAVEYGRTLAREAGIDDVVTHRAGNALMDDLGRDYDVVLLANVAHHFSPEQNVDLARRARASLTSGGTFAIWETEQPGHDAESDIVGDAFALFFRIMSTSRTYAVEEYVGWLEAAGYVDIQALRPPMGPGMVLTAGRTPE
jgi:O-methyltransferase domain